MDDQPYYIESTPWGLAVYLDSRLAYPTQVGNRLIVSSQATPQTLASIEIPDGYGVMPAHLDGSPCYFPEMH